MFYKISITLCLLLMGHHISMAQVTRNNVWQYVYLIKVTEAGSTKTSMSTGFKLKGHTGIFTVLHGSLGGKNTKNINITATRFPKDGKDSDQYCQKLEIVAVDIARDYVHLTCPKQEGCTTLFEDDGFEFSKDTVSSGQKVHIYGFPETPSLDGREGEVLDPAMKNLVGIAPEEVTKRFASYGMPEIKGFPGTENVTVIKLKGTDILPGHSGAPVLTTDYKLIGMADGAIYNGQHMAIMAWAMHITDIPKSRYKDESSKVEKLRTLNIPELKALVREAPVVKPVAIDNDKFPSFGYDAFNFPPSKPFLTFGGTLSRPLWFANDGVQADLNQLHKNGRFDGYAEMSVGKSWCSIGFYVSSRYLQYSILKSFDLNIPLQTERTIRQAKAIDSYGVQASYIFHRGVVHNAYAGGGYFPRVRFGDSEDDARLRFNYRAFVGYRLYAGPRRKFGLEVRAMYVGQNILEYQPTLGIARLKVQPLNQLYVCGGLTYSIYRHE